jgi:SAM-dependent methyltransferase
MSPTRAPAAAGATTAPTGSSTFVPEGDARAHAPGVSANALLLVFTLTTFANAALLFLVEPLFSKLVLPLLGGSSAVWTTCMLFYQGVLLAGYVYVHLGSRWLGARRQAAVHLALFAASCLFLPVALAPGWTAPTEGTPVFWLLGFMLASLGLPFFCLSAGAPLLQRWFAGTGHPRRDDPYFLYAASNAGSMVALLAYPLLVEPLLPLTAQSRAWSVAYGVLGLALAASAALLWRSHRPAADAPAAVARPSAAESIPWSRRARWLALSAVPSSLLLGVTAHLSTDVAPVPLLWVVPLALYLLTFVWAFSPRGARTSEATARGARLVAILFVVALAFGWKIPPALALPWELIVFTLLTVVCHTRLAADRPAVGNLTEYYVWMSLGGVIGGVFNALVAPVVFPGLYEYPLALVAGLGLVAAALPHDARRGLWWRDVAVAAGVGFAVWGAMTAAASQAGVAGAVLKLALSGAAAVALLACADRPLRLTLAAGAAFGAFSLAGGGGSGDVLLRARSFYGSYRVERIRPAADTIRMMVHGSTIHGAQFVDAARAREPLTYYARSGPVGDAFAALPGRTVAGRVAAVGLGTGSLACYAVSGARWTFFEIDPVVVRMATPGGQFDFVERCAPGARVRLGDARVVLSRMPDGQFDLLVLDAFSSDAIPTHLLTREAFRDYARLLAPGGVMLVHVSNRYLRLGHVVQAGAADLGMRGWTRRSVPTDAERAQLITPAEWIALARRPEDVGGLAGRPGWRPLDAAPVAWSDDFSNVVGILGRRR